MERNSLKLRRKYSRESIRVFFEKALTECDGTHFFYYVQQDVIDALNYYLEADVDFDAASTIAYYEGAMAQEPNLAYTGGVYTFLPRLTDLAGHLSASVLPVNRLTARILEHITRVRLNGDFDEAAVQPVHGFFFTGSIPVFELTTYSIPCSITCLDEMVDFFDVTRDFFLGLGREWNQYLPMEWRIFEVADDEMLLEHLQPGRYLNVELWTFRLEDKYNFSRHYAELERLWRAQFPGGGIHHSKQYAFGPVEGVGQAGDLFPFQDEAILDSVYPPQVRADFLAAMDLYDPKGVFRAGSVLRLLGLTDQKYSQKQFVGDTCRSNSVCFSGCCDQVLLGDNTCVTTDKDEGEACSADCECVAGTKCKRTLSSLSAKNCQG
jgi:hypothetical protein